MTKSNRATEFSKDLRRFLADHRGLSTKIGVEDWRRNWKPKTIRSECVDVVDVRRDGTPAVLIEAELRRDDPVCNVLKIWKWATDGIIEKPFVT